MGFPQPFSKGVELLFPSQKLMGRSLLTMILFFTGIMQCIYRANEISRFLFFCLERQGTKFKSLTLSIFHVIQQLRSSFWDHPSVYQQCYPPGPTMDCISKHFSSVPCDNRKTIETHHFVILQISDNSSDCAPS